MRSATNNVAYASGMTYNALGQIKRIQYSNGLETRYSYYGLDTPEWGNSYYSRLLQVCVIGQGAPTCPYTQAGTDKLNLIYGYDNVGNVAGTRDWTNDNQVQWYTYDSLDRLVWGRTQALGYGNDHGRYDERYAYNAIGNVISRTAVTYGYSDTLHLHAATHLNGVQKYWYDANGNMTRRIEGSVTYTQTWDIENRLTVVTATNSLALTVTRFYYDGDGQRVLRVNGDGSKTAYIGNLMEVDLAAPPSPTPTPTSTNTPTPTRTPANNLRAMATMAV